MQYFSLLLLSVAVGIMVVIQGSLSARLGILLMNPVFASSIAMITGAIYSLVVVLLMIRQYPTVSQMKEVPLYLWFIGGLLSFIAVSLFYYVIPRLGISTAVTFGLTGQLIFAAIASHLGWFGMPLEPISIKKVIGMMVMVVGVVLIKY